MSLVRKDYSFDEILEKLKNFIDYLYIYFPGKINNTDFRKYVTALEEIKNGNIDNNYLLYLPIIHKFIFLYDFIQDNSYIDYNKDKFKLKLKELIKRDGNLPVEQDGKQKYNRELFEFSMAARFATYFSHLVTNDNEKIINISDDCDVIVQNEIGIECKYINSLSKVRERLFEGVKQINQRVLNSKIKYGFVALDLSFLLNNFNGIMDLQQDFQDVDQMLITVRQQYQNLIIQEMRKIILKFINELWKKEEIEIKPSAILFQSYNYTFIEHEDKLIPVFYRILDYVINPETSEENISDTQEIIRNLATGI